MDGIGMALVGACFEIITEAILLARPEWRDREVKNRLRIVRITLITAIVVALISLGYDYLRARPTAAGNATPLVEDAEEPEVSK